MSYRALDSDGIFRFYADRAFLHLLNNLVQQRIRKTAKQEVARKEILQHSFVCINEPACAEERFQRGHVKEAGQLLTALAPRLTNGEIVQFGLEGTTGNPGLEATHLKKGHGVRLRKLSDNYLLLSVDRHPGKGTRPSRVLYWLYDDASRSAHLLHHRESVQQASLVGKPKRFVAGKWEEIDDVQQTDFLNIVEKYLGTKGVRAVKEHFKPQETGYLEPPKEVWDQCNSLTDTDFQAEGKKAHECREKEYQQLRGEEQQHATGRIEWIVDAGFRLGMKSESNKEM